MHAELDPDLIGRVVDRPEPGDQATGGRGDRRGGILKGLIGLLHEGGAILPEPAHHRTGGRLIDLNQDAAALVEREFDETLHQVPHQNTCHRHADAVQPDCQGLDKQARSTSSGKSNYSTGSPPGRKQRSGVRDGPEKRRRSLSGAGNLLFVPRRHPESFNYAFAPKRYWTRRREKALSG